MKIEAQLNNQPTIRNLAKLLMNSMYGRFGMHTDAVQSAIIPSTSFEMYSSNFEIISNIELKTFNLISYTNLEKEIRGNAEIRKIIREFQKTLEQKTNVALASAVTSYSRMIINGFKLKP